MIDKIYISGIKHDSIVEGCGLRNVVFVSGCGIHALCRGCHNPSTHSPTNGEHMDIASVVDDLLEDGNGITISGGDPFTLQLKASTELVRSIKSRNQSANIWIYSGFMYDEIVSNKDRFSLLEMCDVLVDGLYQEDKKDISLRFRGSSNQRIIDIKKSLERKEVILYCS